MKIFKMDIQNGEFELRCPYCNEVILAEGIPGNEITDGSCDHLLFVFSPDCNEFLEATNTIEELYNEVSQASDDGFVFDEFVKVLGSRMSIENFTSVELIDTYDTVLFWFKP